MDTRLARKLMNANQAGGDAASIHLAGFERFPSALLPALKGVGGRVLQQHAKERGAGRTRYAVTVARTPETEAILRYVMGLSTRRECETAVGIQ